MMLGRAGRGPSQVLGLAGLRGCVGNGPVRWTGINLFGVIAQSEVAEIHGLPLVWPQRQLSCRRVGLSWPDAPMISSLTPTTGEILGNDRRFGQQPCESPDCVARHGPARARRRL